MRHEPSGLLPSLQPTADQRCLSCRAVRSMDDSPHGAGYAGRLLRAMSTPSGRGCPSPSPASPASGRTPV
jgi:hypothetical protein